MDAKALVTEAAGYGYSPAFQNQTADGLAHGRVEDGVLCSHMRNTMSAVALYTLLDTVAGNNSRLVEKRNIRYFFANHSACRGLSNLKVVMKGIRMFGSILPAPAAFSLPVPVMLGLSGNCLAHLRPSANRDLAFPCQTTSRECS